MTKEPFTLSYYFFLQCKYTCKSDVWSFGVLLWEILNHCQVRPYAQLPDDELVIEQLNSAMTEDEITATLLERPNQCPKDVYDLMRECWNRDAEKRPAFKEINLFLQRKILNCGKL